MFADKSGGATLERSKQGTYTFDVQSEKPLTPDQLNRLAILIADAVRLTTGKASFCVPVHK